YFEGYTHPERFLVLTTTHGFGDDFAACSRNYFSDPDEWSALFKVAGDDGKGRWRIVFPTRPGETAESAFEEGAVQNGCRDSSPRWIPIRLSTAICTMYTSASLHRSVKGAPFLPATPPTSTTRWAGSVSISEFTMRWSCPPSWPASSAMRRRKTPSITTT